MEKEKLLKEHLITDEKGFVDAYNENPPQIQEKLEWQPGEAIISELSTKDLIQLASRYLNNDAVYTKNILHLLIRMERLLTWLLEAQGVDVQARFREDAKKQAELLEKRIEDSKAELKKAVENNKNKN